MSQPRHPHHATAAPPTRQDGRIGCEALRLRSYEAADAGRVVQMVADVLERLYPTGGEWLDRLRALEPDRYGAGRDEVVLAWTPDGEERSTDRGWINDQLGQVRALKKS